MEERFNSIIERLHGGLMPEVTILAVSGGIDSVVMAHLYAQSGYDFSIAHCNFQLRAEDSDKDESFVRALGEQLGVNVYVKHFETQKIANEKGISIQMAARELRYAWFNQLANEHGAVIAIGHHANDVVETMLFNLAKGTGLAGLHGIKEQDGIFLRPLLWANKDEIERYAQQNNLGWCNDVSNESEKYMRNIIRRKVVPELKRINPALVNSSLRTAKRIRLAEDFMQYAISQLALVETRGEDVYLKKAGLEELPGKEAVLYQLLNVYGFSYDQVNTIIKSWAGTGAIFMAGKWVLNIDRDYLILSKHDRAAVEVVIKEKETRLNVLSEKIIFNTFPILGYKISNDPAIAAMDYDRLTFPLTLRNWQQGDYFVPLGMQGRKKVSDYMIDEKIPVKLKSKLMVLVSDNEIVWLVGHRLDNRYKITKTTQMVYQVTLQKK